METTTRVFPDVASDSCSSSMRQRWRRGKPAEPLRLRGCAVHRAMPGSSARRRHPRLESDRDERPMGDRRSVPGPALAVKPGEVTLYRFPNHTPLCWNATWRTDCRTVIYKQRRRQHGPGRDRVPRGIRLHGGRPGQDRHPERQGRRLRLVPLMGSRIRLRSSSGPVTRSGHSSTSVRFGPCLRKNPSHFPFNSQ